MIVCTSLLLPATDSLPRQIADDAFWKLIEDASEPNGEFPSENFVSNEAGFQMVLPALLEVTKSSPNGVYIGVGPEQNFTYAAALRSKMAFVIDIRRQNMLVHLIYKALFEMSDNRADFIARLFSRRRPEGISKNSSVAELFNAFAPIPYDTDSYQKNLEGITNLLLTKHKFGLTRQDQTNIEHVFLAFREYGPGINYNSGTVTRVGAPAPPNYADVMTATDTQGIQQSYLANEENYRFIRDMEGRNMMIPLTGDFGGTKAFRAVGQYLKDHGATVSAFYTSNVEEYLFQSSGGPVGDRNPSGTAPNFYANVAMLPLDAASTFIRSGGQGRGGLLAFMRGPSRLYSIHKTLTAIEEGRIKHYDDLFDAALQTNNP